MIKKIFICIKKRNLKKMLNLYTRNKHVQIEIFYAVCAKIEELCVKRIFVCV